VLSIARRSILNEVNISLNEFLTPVLLNVVARGDEPHERMITVILRKLEITERYNAVL
jgi:hypothetical protein